MQSKAATVAAYLAELPAERRAIVEAVRAFILKNLDNHYVETMQYGMIGYAVPHSVFPPGYHCDPKQPLPFAALAAQKNFYSLYLMGLYCGCGTDLAPGALTPEAAWFHDAWAAAVAEGRAKRLDMGKSCVRFKRLEDIPLDVIGKAIKRCPAKVYVAYYTQMLENRDKPAQKSKAAAKKKAKAKPR